MDEASYPVHLTDMDKLIPNVYNGMPIQVCGKKYRVKNLWAVVEKDFCRQIIQVEEMEPDITAEEIKALRKEMEEYGKPKQQKQTKVMKAILFTDKTRWQHFGYAIPIGLVFTILCVLGVASGMEFKDKKWGGKWDWSDWTCTMLGGAAGQVIQLYIIFLIWLWS